MRLYNTATRKLDELPAPPGPIRMYFCGPTVYQRIHVGNARPFVDLDVAQALARAAGYDVTLVENITDINDKIYDAAPGRQRAARRGRGAVGTSRTRSDLGLGRPDHEPKATETIPEIVALIEELIERDLAYPAGGDVYFRVDRFPDYGAALGPARRGVRAATRPRRKSRPRSRRTRATSRSGRRTRRARTRRGSRRGESGGPAGTSSARRWPRSTSGPSSRSTAAGSTSSSRTTRTRSPSRAAPGREFAQALDAQRDAPLRRREDVEVARQRGHAAGRARRVGAGDAADAVPRRALAQADGLHGRDARSGEGAGGRLPRGVPQPVGAGRLVGRSRRGTGGRLQHARGARGHARVARPRPPAPRPRDLRAGLARGAGGSAGRAATSWRSGVPMPARAATIDEADRLRQEIEAQGWEVRDVAGDSGYRLVPKR